MNEEISSLLRINRAAKERKIGKWRFPKMPLSELTKVKVEKIPSECQFQIDSTQDVEKKISHALASL